MVKIDGKSCLSIKKMISTSEWSAENTQQICVEHWVEILWQQKSLVVGLSGGAMRGFGQIGAHPLKNPRTTAIKSAMDASTNKTVWDGEFHPSPNLRLVYF